jgi:hypothetical protein
MEMIDRRNEILKVLRATPIVLRRLTVGVDDRRLRQRPDRNEWAIIEVVGHIADVEERALARVRRMLRERHPHLDPFDQAALAEERRYIDMDLESELRRFEELRGMHLDELDALHASDWQRTGDHGVHGEMSIELYETHVAAEEVDHLAQIARLPLIG